jgi:hypothetical protein
MRVGTAARVNTGPLHVLGCSPVRVGSHELFDCNEQGLRRKGLPHERPARLGVFWVGSADQEDPDARVHGGDPSGEFVAIEPGHTEVSDEQIRGSGPLTGESQGGEAIRCALHVITSTGEHALHEAEHDGLVVDDQNHRGGIRLRGCHKPTLWR